MDKAGVIREYSSALPDRYRPLCQRVAEYLDSGAEWGCFEEILKSITLLSKDGLTESDYALLGAITSLRGDTARGDADFNYMIATYRSIRRGEWPHPL